MLNRCIMFLMSFSVFVPSLWSQIPYSSVNQSDRLLNQAIDVSGDFYDYTNTYYCPARLTGFDPSTGQGVLNYKRYQYSDGFSFNNTQGSFKEVRANEFPSTEYAAEPALPFSLEFVSSRTVRIKALTRFQTVGEQDSLMLIKGKVVQDRSGWKYEQVRGGHKFTSDAGSVTLFESPWRLEFRDSSGKLLTHTMSAGDGSESFTNVMPWCFVRRASDYSTSNAAVLRLSPGEKIFGCGESFTNFNKRGQKVVFFTDDANGVQNETMYKPVPFYMSSRGYGVFMHTSTPITCDFGKYYDSANAMMIGDETLDLFVFLGQPKDILDEYTDLTGKAAMPPLWSFGFWMSRITYLSEQQGREVATKLRENRIPADVIHFDTGWFETDWRCDYQFAPERFTDPAKMMADFKEMGLRTCLWQLPYFVPKNSLFSEIIDKGMFVHDRNGNLPGEDAILDFSNPATISWYQDKIAGLLKRGVSVIKVDFGEAGPLEAVYASGKTGFYEHNLYPLRYNKAVAEITKATTGDTIIWARSAWAGSQRYPLHWGGDAENTDSAMAGTLRGGLSFGLSGFSFWSHDIGGFVKRTPEDLYRRWTPFGMFTSHTRSHGQPPKEPWEYGEDFTNAFRLADEMRYKLMPYIYAQAKDCSERGLPMVRALFVEYPDDPGSWLIDNEYLFGSDMLVAPLFENSSSRDVYLPGGKWIDYQTGKVYTGGWHKIEAGVVPIVVLVRDGAAIPHVKLAQSTAFIDFKDIELKVYTADRGSVAKALVCLPTEQKLYNLTLNPAANDYVLTENPLASQGVVIRPTTPEIHN